MTMQQGILHGPAYWLESTPDTQRLTAIARGRASALRVFLLTYDDGAREFALFRDGKPVCADAQLAPVEQRFAELLGDAA